MSDEHMVLLGETVVGTLAIVNDAPLFSFTKEYCEGSPRPILSLSFEEEPPVVERSFTEADGRLPRFFRNVLPEGQLLRILDRSVESARHREFELLSLIGSDLPGAVRVVRDPLAEQPATAAPEPRDGFAFGLSGMQFKLQAKSSDQRLTIPARGEGALWIAKFGAAAYPGLVENEWAMLTWARGCGLNTPQFQLRHSDDFDDPTSVILDVFRGSVLLVQRFDRGSDHRIHQEDFAQILSLHPEQKYDADVDDTVHYTTIANIIAAHCGRRDAEEFVKRLVFMVLCGNGDAHTKNWALIHRSRPLGVIDYLFDVFSHGDKPSLSPLYDFVSTIAYRAAFPARQLALQLSGELRIDAITSEHIVALCTRVGFTRDEAGSLVADFCAQARFAWKAIRENVTIPRPVLLAVDENLALCAKRGL